MEKKQRLSYLDIAKGIGIILVILGHIDIGPATKWVYSFDLPLFYLITGLCFNYKENFFEYLKSKAKRCLIPYCFFGIFIVLVESKTGYLYEKTFSRNLMRLLIQRRYSTLWFLATLFVASLIFYLIVKICKQNVTAVFVVSTVLSIIFVHLDMFLIDALPWNIDTAFIVLGFIGAGYFIKNKGLMDKMLALSKGKRTILTLCFFLLNLVGFLGNLIIFRSSLEMYWNSYGFYPFMYLAAISGSLFTLLISASIKCAPLEALGRNSMTFFAMHQSIIMWPVTLLLRNMGLIKKNMPLGQDILTKLIIFTAIILGCALVDTLLRKTKLKFLLGE